MATLASIRSAIYDAMDAMTTANGYNYTYKVNESTDPHDNASSGQTDADFPKISLDDSAAEQPNDELNVATMDAYSVIWQIIVFYRAVEGDAARLVRSKVSADVQKMVSRQDNSGLGGNALRFRFDEGDINEMQLHTQPEKLIFSVETIFHRSY